MNPCLEGVRIAITGAFGGLGAVTAAAAARSGARVALIGRSTTAMLPPDLPAGAIAAVVSGIDLADPLAASRAIDESQRRLDGLDVLLNIAGAFCWQPVAGGDTTAWDEQFSRNLRTALNCSRAALPHLRRSPAGRIVNVGAHAALRAAQGMGPYAASKSAVHRLTEALAEELKADGITVNAVLPSVIDTPANRRDMPGAEFSRWVTTDQVAAVMLFLAGPAAQGISGALIPVTGRL